MHGDGVGVLKLIQFVELLVDVLVLQGVRAQPPVEHRQGGDGADGAVEYRGRAFVVVVAVRIWIALSPGRNTRAPLPPLRHVVKRFAAVSMDAR